MRDPRVLFVTVELLDDGWWDAVLWGLHATRLASGQGRSPQQAIEDASSTLRVESGPMARGG